MRLDQVGLVVRPAVLLRLPQLLEQREALALDATLQPPASTRVDQVDQLLRRQVKQVVEVDTTVGELAEGALLLQLERGGLIISLSTGGASREAVSMRGWRRVRRRRGAGAEAEELTIALLGDVRAGYGGGCPS